MKMGIKEFRERIGEVALGEEPVVLTHHGKRVGRYVPDRAARLDDAELRDWLGRMQAFGRQWRAVTPDWRERLRALGEPEEDIAALEAEDRCC